MNKWIRNYFATLREMFDFKDDFGRGRFYILMGTLLTGVAGQLYGSVFYTRYLLMNGITQTGIGILSFVPYLGCLLSIVSPYIIEHFRKRKWLIVIVGTITNFISIMGITLLPLVVEDAGQRLIGFVLITLSARVIGDLFSAAGGPWEAVYLTEDVRADFLAFRGAFLDMVIWGSALAVSVVADRLHGTEYEMPLLIGIRVAGWLLTIAASVFTLLRKEFPYERTTTPSLSNVFRLPLKNKMFLGTMAILFVYNFVRSMPGAFVNAWLLEDLKLSYTMISVINSLYFVFVLAFMKLWTKCIKKYGWINTMAIGMLLEMGTNIAYSFVTSERLTLFVGIRLAQHFTGVPVCLVASGLVYLNLPDTDRSYYMTFAGLVTSLAGFLTTFVGTVITGMLEGRTVMFFGEPFVSTQILIFFTGVGELLLAVLCLATAKKLSPRRLP